MGRGGGGGVSHRNNSVLTEDLVRDQFSVHHLSNRALFPVYIALSKHDEGWENSRQLCKPKT